jgi:HAD superfamily hydrolase (TIGR01459 family)
MISRKRIDALLDRYDAFLIDQFGTLHDGTSAYPGAEAALLRLRAAGRRVLLVSNSGRPTEPNVRRLAAMGIGPESYEALITSGEVAASLIEQGQLDVARGVHRVLLLERAGEGSILDRLDMEAVSPEAAQLVLIAGSDGDTKTLCQYGELLEPLARAGVPALCLNPDRIMLTATGFAFGAGQIAQAYESFGGEVSFIGKPYPDIYRAALAHLGRRQNLARVTGVGDSAEHDIAGAHAAGCDGWLVRAGLIEGWTDAAIDAECDRKNVTPDGILESVG